MMKTAAIPLDKISVVEPQDPEYDSFNEACESSYQLGVTAMTRFYNQLVEVINDAPVGAIVTTPVPTGIKYANLKRVIYNRGFEKADLTFGKQKLGKDGRPLPKDMCPVWIRKESDVQGRIVSIKD